MFFFKFINFIYKKIIFRKRKKKITEIFNLDSHKKYVWGMKKSGKKIRAKFKNTNKLVYLEDGFINSLGIHKNDIPLSICIDNGGIYYNYKSQSDLFQYISEELNKDNA